MLIILHSISGLLSTVVEEYKVSAADSNVADLSSALTILTQLQPFSNHNGGNLMFGKDGYLYINLGDGGSGVGDPFKNGQNKNTFLAKILRIDVSNSSSSTTILFLLPILFITILHPRDQERNMDVWSSQSL